MGRDSKQSTVRFRGPLKFPFSNSYVVQECNAKKLFGTNFDPENPPVASYVNFHLVNGAVIIPAFGDDEADAAALRVIGEQFPDRKVEQVYLHQLALQGGGIHCATQQVPA